MHTQVSVPEVLFLQCYFCICEWRYDFRKNQYYQKVMIMEFAGELPYTEKNNKKKAVHQILCLKEKIEI